MKKKKYEYHPIGWQLNPDSLSSGRVQFWANGILLHNVSCEEAKERVQKKEKGQDETIHC